MPALATHILLAFLLFQIKHLLADFVLQTEKMVDEKGYYGRRGGLQHAAIHVVASAPIVIWLSPGVAALATVLVAEFVVHYHIDLCKEKIGWRLRLEHADRGFWVAMGIDQFLHQCTYIGMIWWLVS